MVLWGLRLFFHFFRRGYYKLGGEDYRWTYIKKTRSKLFVEINNFFIISYYQFFLVLLYITAFYYCKGETKTLDYVLIPLAFLCFVGEAVADQQQYTFQTKKYELLAKENDLSKLPAPYNLGFRNTGLFKYCRHPNYFFD